VEKRVLTKMDLTGFAVSPSICVSLFRDSPQP